MTTQLVLNDSAVLEILAKYFGNVTKISARVWKADSNDPRERDGFEVTIQWEKGV